MKHQKLIKATFCTLILCTLLLPACRKNDFTSQPKKSNQGISDFFTLPSGTHPAVARIAQKLKTLHDRTGFVHELIEKDGLALWEKALVTLPTRSGRSTHTGSNADTMIYIPLALGNTDYVDAFIYAKLGDSIQMQLHRGREYASYGFGNIQDSTDNAERLALQLMMLNLRAFGHTHFLLNDNRLFNSVNSSSTVGSKRMLKISTADGQNRATMAGRTGQWESLTVTVCITNTQYHCTNTGSCASGTCDDCYLCKETSTSCESVVQYYFVPDDDDGFDNGINSWGGGGSGSGPINTNGPQPCNPTPLLDNGQLPCEEGNLTGWTIRDEYGFLFTRKAQLDSLLSQNRFALLPCDSTILMPFLSYGPMYQKVAQQQVPQAVLSRLDSLTNVSILTSSAFTVQPLDSAYGPVVNCDFFPIKISQMPLKPNGTPFTPKELLEHFRLLKNDFISPSIGVSFEPYNYNGFNDSALFNAPYEQSIGAILHIDMFNDGTIVHTGYRNHINPINNYQEHSFIYTTLSSSLDLGHPVSGNREFGIYSDQNNPGSFVFYTMGVDRVTDWIFSTGDDLFTGMGFDSGFEDADELWTNIQENMINFINVNGGQASFYTNKNTIARPKWDDAVDFLKGHISIEQYKQRLGC